MKQSYASAGKAPRRRVHSPSGIAAIAVFGLPPPRIRGGSLRLVRQLRSYYCWVRLPAFVHHRLSVFPSRCGPEAGLPWPNAGSPKFRRDPFARDLLFDPGRAGRTSLSGPVHVAFDSLHGLCSCDVPITGLNHTPHATAVYASWPASPSAHATLASRLPAGHYLGRTFTD